MTGVACYPWHERAEALLQVIRQAGLGPRHLEIDDLPAGADLVEVAAHHGVEAWPIRLEHGQVRAFLAQAEPCLLRAVGPSGDGSIEAQDDLVAIVRGGKKWCRIAATGSTEARTKARTDDVQSLLTDDLRRAAEEESEPLLADLPPAERTRALRALSEERMHQVPAV